MFRIFRDGLQIIETESVSVLLEWLEKHGDDYNPREIDIQSRGDQNTYNRDTTN